MSISVSIIILAHRADDRLLASIESAQFANEVIIIDNNSNTNWPQLPAHLHFVVVPYLTPITDWSTVRNFAMTHTTHDWVMFLDSDEVITVESIPSISNLIEKNVFDGALVMRSDIFKNKQLKYGEAGAMPILRMGKKSVMKYERPIHEEARVEGKVTASDITLLHHSHLSIAEFFNTISDYARREALFRQEQGERLWLPSIFLLPLGKFILNYIGKLGFLDGFPGFIYAFMMSLHSLFVRIYQYELEHSRHVEVL